MEQFPFGPCTVEPDIPKMTSSTGINLNFVTPINKVFPSPLGKVFLVFNAAGDLSLYRQSEHVWSAGLFRNIMAVQWSPDCKKMGEML